MTEPNVPLGELLRQRAKLEQEHRERLKTAEGLKHGVIRVLVAKLVDKSIVAVDETGRQWEYARSVADGMIAKGLIIYDSATRTYTITNNNATNYLPDVEIGICDFCGEQPIVWLAATESFLQSHNNARSHGGWAACDPCGLCILKRSRSALFHRAIKRFSKDLPLKAVPFIKAEVVKVHAGFWDHFASIQLIPESDHPPAERATPTA